jgi:hypothetical protein
MAEVVFPDALGGGETILARPREGIQRLPRDIWAPLEVGDCYGMMKIPV